MKKITGLSVIFIGFLALGLNAGPSVVMKVKDPEPKPGVKRQNAEQAQTGFKKMGLSLKLSGGATFLFNGAGDLEKLRSGRMNFVEDHRFEKNFTTTFGWEKLSLIPDLDAEIIFNITPKFGMGIGSGFINATSEGTYSLKEMLSYNNEVFFGLETKTDTYTQDYKIRVIPINFNLTYFTPLGDSRKFNFYIYGGVGYYFGKLTHDQRNDYTSQREIQWVDDEYESSHSQFAGTKKEESKQNRVGFKTGLGFEMNLTSSIALGLEGFGRIVNFNNWEGDFSDDWNDSFEYDGDYIASKGSSREHGSLWIYDVKHNNKNYADMWIREHKPEGDSFSNVKKAAINLNAFGAQISLRFHFDL